MNDTRVRRVGDDQTAVSTLAERRSFIAFAVLVESVKRTQQWVVPQDMSSSSRAPAEASKVAPPLFYPSTPALRIFAPHVLLLLRRRSPHSGPLLGFAFL